MSDQTPSISNVSINQIDGGSSFQSFENPLVYSGAFANNAVNVSVIVPFHNNVNPEGLPTVTLSQSADGNNVSIIPDFDSKIPLNNVYTQVVKISFQINNPLVSDNQVTVNVTVDEEGQPDTSDRFGAPIRKTKVIIPSEPA